MDMKNWTEMVTIELPVIGEYRHVGSTFEAVDCLLSQWRGKEGRTHREAVRACLCVLDGDRASDHARKAFIAAANDSDIFVHH